MIKDSLEASFDETFCQLESVMVILSQFYRNYSNLQGVEAY